MHIPGPNGNGKLLSNSPLQRVAAMLEACDSKNSVMPATEFYNEAWMLRLTLDWFSQQPPPMPHALTFATNAQWFSDARLPTPSLFRALPEYVAESWTRTDAVVGHFDIGSDGHAHVTLGKGAEQFIVIQASPFSAGVADAWFFDQAALEVACVAEMLSQSDRAPTSIPHLAYYVLAPREQIDRGTFTSEMSKDSIRAKVVRRAEQDSSEHSTWLSSWFLPTLDRIEVSYRAWEDTLAHVSKHDSDFGSQLAEFYVLCLVHNRPRTRDYPA